MYILGLILIREAGGTHWGQLTMCSDEPLTDMEASDELNKTGPNYFGFYTHQVADLLSEDAVCEPSSSQCSKVHREVGKTDTSKPRNTGKTAISFRDDGPLFSNGIGSGLSDYKREKLKGLLTESVAILTQEVDELLHPVVKTRKLIFQLNSQSYSGAAPHGDAGKPPSKKPKISSSTCSSGVPMQATSARSKINKNEERESLLESQVNTEIENEAMSDDLKLLMENKEQSLEALKKCSDELFSTLEHMEQKLEELLNTVVEKSRAMTIFEKQELRTMIEKLSPRNLDRVVEIIQHGKSSEDNEHFIDLEEVDNSTLWRLYYYVEAVVNARKLADKTHLLL